MKISQKELSWNLTNKVIAYPLTAWILPRPLSAIKKNTPIFQNIESELESILRCSFFTVKEIKGKASNNSTEKQWWNLVENK